MSQWIKVPHCSVFLKVFSNKELLSYLRQKTYKERPNVKISEIRKIRKFVKVPILIEPVVNGQNGWDGQFLRVKGLSIDGLFHEISHYIVSPNSRKKYQDFGLGIGFNSKGITKCVVSRDYAYKEEYLTCVLEWILLYNFGYKHYINSTIQSEGFFKENYLELSKLLSEIIKRYGVNSEITTNKKLVSI